MHRPPRRAVLVTTLVALGALCLPAAAQADSARDGVGQDRTARGDTARASAEGLDRAGGARRGRTVLVSAAPGGQPGGGSSFAPRVSGNGRYAVFTSDAPDLVPGDTNAADDVYVRDLRSGRTERVNVPTGGGQSDGSAGTSDISGDGRYVAFVSSAGNLAPGGKGGIFAHDRRTDRTWRVSPASEPDDGSPRGFSYGPTISADGRYVGFTSSSPALDPGQPRLDEQAYVHDLRTGRTERISEGMEGQRPDRTARTVEVSADGRYVSFVSAAGNLVPGDTNGDYDTFVRDRRTGGTERISVADDGSEAGPHDQSGGAMSADGRFVAFESADGNLVRGDTNGTTDLFVHDRLRRGTERVSVGAGGGELGRRSLSGEISGDGRYVSFATSSPDAVPGDTNGRFDVFLRDRVRGTTTRVSLGDEGQEPDRDSIASALDHTGRVAAFGTLAANLIPGDTNDAPDVFTRRHR